MLAAAAPADMGDRQRLPGIGDTQQLGRIAERAGLDPCSPRKLSMRGRVMVDDMTPIGSRLRVAGVARPVQVRQDRGRPRAAKEQVP